MGPEDSLFGRTGTHAISSIAYRCLLYSLHALRDQRPLSTTHTQILVLRILPFERKLLTALLKDALPEFLLQGAQHPGPIDQIWFRLFYRWSWASCVLRQMLAELHPHTMEIAHEGDQTRAWETCLKFLRTKHSRVDSDRRYYRTEQLIRDNASFVSQVGSLDLWQIAIEPHEDDVVLWRQLGFLYSQNFGVVRHWPGFQAISAGFSKLNYGFTTRANSGSSLLVEKGLEGAPHALEHMKELVLMEDIGGKREQNTYNLPYYALCRTWSTFEDSMPKPPADITSDILVNIVVDTNDTWDVWSLVRSFHLYLAAKSEPSFFGQLLDSHIFLAHWEKKAFRYLENDLEEEGYFPKKVQTKSEELSEDAYLRDFVHSKLSMEYEKRIKSRPLTNLPHLIRYIPWDEINSTHQETFQEALEDLNLPDSEVSNAEFKVWTPRGNDYANHIYYLTEDLYCHYIDEGYSCPGFIQDGNMIFRCCRLEESKFIPELYRFRQEWNDVAITKDPSNNQFYLLETLPGIMARKLNESDNESATMLFFDSKWRYRIRLRSQRDHMKEVLGINYDRSYNDFLVYIESTEFDLEEGKVIGEGSFGKVYCLPWKQKPVEVSLDHIEEQRGNVAVKIAHKFPGQDVDAEAKLFAELATVYKAVKGGTTLAGFVKFFGFTKLPINKETNSIWSSGNVDGTEFRLALVFEYANGGSLSGYLEQHLRPGNPYEAWITICSQLLDVARGLEEIHSKSIVHRDIHPGNVLVHGEADPATGGSAEESSYVLLADLGEAKITDAMFSDAAKKSRLSHSEYVPPEVHTQGYTTKSDIFAWAQLAVDVIRKSHLALVGEDKRMRFPKRFMFILENCLASEAGMRPSAAVLVANLTDVVMELFVGPNEAIAWIEGDYELPTVAQRLSTSLQLCSDWYRSD